MRNEFASAIEKAALKDEKIIFLTGDLGYNALENVQQSMGERFVNCGVAEQNMVGMAAGLAYKGYKVFCYSIAPFIVYRCWEQFRNDVCLHNLPVFLVGNGGGYGYGIMGSSHHAIEDLSGLSSLQNVKCYVPGFSFEVEHCVNQILTEARPSYLRLGYGTAQPEVLKDHGSLRLLIEAKTPRTTVVSLGPVTNNVLTAIKNTNADLTLISCISVPLEISDPLMQILADSKNILVVEEHVSIGGLAQQLSLKLLEKGIRPEKFISLRAEGYPDGTYGSQGFHQKQSGLDVSNIEQVLKSFN